MTMLYQASRQWAQRPDDERFASLEEMHSSAEKDRSESAIATVRSVDLRFDAEGEEVVLHGSKGATARMTSFAFEQECGAVGAPSSYLRTLPAELASKALQCSHDAKPEDSERRLLFHNNGSGLMLRGSTSPKYARVWDADVIARLIDLQGMGWRVPLAWAPTTDAKGAHCATAEEVRAFSSGASIVKEGDTVAPSGLYRSAKDFFAFMVDPSKRVRSPSGRELFRGFFVSQSEVGSQAWKLAAFYFDFVCGNHNVWGAELLGEVRVIHVGDAERLWREKVRILHEFQNQGTEEEEANLRHAAEFLLGKNKAEVVDAVFGRKLLSRADAGAAFDLATQFEDGGDPRSAWGFANGLTRLSQAQGNGDKRTRLDSTAGKVLSIAF